MPTTHPLRAPWLAPRCLLATLVLAACHAGGGQSVTALPPSDGADVRQQVCQSRVNDTAAKLEQCITRAWLWRRLAHFQTIADENPGTLGHANRDTGTPGYAASATSIAGLMQRAGYTVTVQKYRYRKVEHLGTPRLRTASHSYTFGQDWFAAPQSADGNVTAAVEAPLGDGTGCSTRGFARFTRHDVAVIERGDCSFDAQVAKARAAGADAVVLYSDTAGEVAYEERLVDPAGIPVAGVVTYADGRSLLRRQASGAPQIAHVEIRSQAKSRVDYNVIADSPYGDASRTWSSRGTSIDLRRGHARQRIRLGHHPGDRAQSRAHADAQPAALHLVRRRGAGVARLALLHAHLATERTAARSPSTSTSTSRPRRTSTC